MLQREHIFCPKIDNIEPCYRYLFIYYFLGLFLTLLFCLVSFCVRSHVVYISMYAGRAAAGVGGASAAGGAVGGGGGGVTPAFVFLQLYHNMSTYPITPPVPGD